MLGNETCSPIWSIRVQIAKIGVKLDTTLSLITEGRIPRGPLGDSAERPPDSAPQHTHTSNAPTSDRSDAAIESSQRVLFKDIFKFLNMSQVR